LKALREKFYPVEKDPFYTFPWMFQYDSMLRNKIGADRCEIIMFFKAGGNTKEDRPRYGLRCNDIQKLLHLCGNYDATIGLHSSYQAGKDPSQIIQEAVHLAEALGRKVTCNRHHYLDSRNPEDMEILEKAGITDDYTMGYADVAGFRLGTSLPVRYINPVTARLSPSLTLHPLTIMDCTLDDYKYMKLPYEGAANYCMKLIDNIRKINDELTLLWHNSLLAKGVGYQRDLYVKLLTELTDYEFNAII